MGFLGGFFGWVFLLPTLLLVFDILLYPVPVLLIRREVGLKKIVPDPDTNGLADPDPGRLKLSQEQKKLRNFKFEEFSVGQD